MPVKDYKKIECVRCGRQMASCATKPKCSSCQGTRFKTIEEFKPEMMIQKHKKPTQTTQTAKPVQQPTTQPEAPQERPKRSLDDEFFGVDE